MLRSNTEDCFRQLESSANSYVGYSTLTIIFNYPYLFQPRRINKCVY